MLKPINILNLIKTESLWKLHVHVMCLLCLSGCSLCSECNFTFRYSSKPNMSHFDFCRRAASWQWRCGIHVLSNLKCKEGTSFIHILTYCNRKKDQIKVSVLTNVPPLCLHQKNGALLTMHLQCCFHKKWNELIQSAIMPLNTYRQNVPDDFRSSGSYGWNHTKQRNVIIAKYDNFRC